MKLEKDEKRTYLIARIIIGAVMTLFFLFGFVIMPNPVEETLWAKLHPMSVLNIIGVILFMITALALAGLPQKLIDHLWAPAGSQWPNYLFFATGILGIIFIWS